MVGVLHGLEKLQADSVSTLTQLFQSRNRKCFDVAQIRVHNFKSSHLDMFYVTSEKPTQTRVPNRTCIL